MNHQCFFNEWKNWSRTAARSASIECIVLGHPTPTYPQHLVEVVVLWPLVVLQEGFPEKQDVQGQPDQLHHTKGERKQKVNITWWMETLRTFLGHSTFNGTSISNCGKQSENHSKKNTSDLTQPLHLRGSVWAVNRSPEWSADIPCRTKKRDSEMSDITRSPAMCIVKTHHQAEAFWAESKGGTMFKGLTKRWVH